ncbi:sugar phosphate isomerase/epimerase family protein [Sphingobacterium sp. T2]|uniref:sugar phosphate isomerase/epimerase family protein n=1 Tax=Sphingobacterium sp. T2 TaxID=1590596 RepID=UPI00068DB877|nr:TIM barrel protein [Sphingobacterium sp. T2]
MIENMLGYELVRSNKKQETPLCRTVDEMTAIMKLMPKDVFAAVDMNHIKHPENLIMALGKRLKSVHIADGDGKKECHYFPCSGEGENDWSAILLALKKVGYKGPFMYECAFKDVKDLRACFEGLRCNYSFKLLTNPSKHALKSFTSLKAHSYIKGPL